MYYLRVIIVLVATLAISSGFKLVPEGRVTNGWTARREDAPYLVSIQGKEHPIYPHDCGGSIINEHWVLTAGHCLKGKDISAIKIHAGRYDLMNAEDSDQVRSIDYYKVHELYVGNVAPYDIALIYTAKPFVWTKFVKPISLPEKNTIPEGSARVSGWGFTVSDGLGNFKLPEVLQTALMPVVSLAECHRNFRNVHETNFCTAATSKGMTVCSGDSGGPLAQKNSNNEDVIIGVVSWGRIHCGIPHEYSVYTRVSAFIDWIAATQKHFENGTEK